MAPGDEINQEEIDRLLRAAGAELSSPELPGTGTALAQGSPAPSGGRGGPLTLPSLEAPGLDGAVQPLEMLMNVELNLRVELGRTLMTIEDVLKLKEGAVITLDKLAGDPLDILANGRLVAKGEILVLNDTFCIRITDIVTPEERLVVSKQDSA